MITVNMPSPGSRFAPGSVVTFGGDNGPPDGATLTRQGGSPVDVPVDGATGTSPWKLDVTLPQQTGTYVFRASSGRTMGAVEFSIKSS
jgi:hypothetical protein